MGPHSVVSVTMTPGGALTRGLGLWVGQWGTVAGHRDPDRDVHSGCSPQTGKGFWRGPPPPPTHTPLHPHSATPHPLDSPSTLIKCVRRSNGRPPALNGFGTHRRGRGGRSGGGAQVTHTKPLPVPHSGATNGHALIQGQMQGGSPSKQ